MAQNATNNKGKKHTLYNIEDTHMHSGPPNAPCLSIVTHIEGRGGGRGRKSFHKVEKKFF